MYPHLHAVPTSNVVFPTFSLMKTEIEPRQSMQRAFLKIQGEEYIGSILTCYDRLHESLRGFILVEALLNM